MRCWTRAPGSSTTWGARGLDDAPAVDLLETVLDERRWWLGQWPDGAEHVPGLVAQDVQERLADSLGRRWPRCRSCDDLDEHALRVQPDLGPHPRWVCERAGLVVAPLGELKR